MRLKEPLYGAKVAGLHFVLHLSLAFTMIYVETMLPEKPPNIP